MVTIVVLIWKAQALGDPGMSFSIVHWLEVTPNEMIRRSRRNKTTVKGISDSLVSQAPTKLVEIPPIDFILGKQNDNRRTHSILSLGVWNGADIVEENDSPVFDEDKCHMWGFANGILRSQDNGRSEGQRPFTEEGRPIFFGNEIAVHVDELDPRLKTRPGVGKRGERDKDWQAAENRDRI
ncbi:hypothetical protein B0H19DRAFT_1074076 [Mycena capillaripes]|nr:hypothetical protein B0H19DRAFT_1074076 [Mycena capillaripes]